ncbi:MAG: hypothetical protein HKP27_01095, partial [Myxococcales bacterium]|nr:hypothetical protein [Myxococcales bacterium]
MKVLRPRFFRPGLFHLGLAWMLMSTGGALSASAATITWTGVLRVIVEDSGGGTYTGGTPDVSLFSGTVTYGDVCGGCLVEPFPPDEVNYVFPGGTGSLTGLGVTTVGVESSVAITDDQILT